MANSRSKHVEHLDNLRCLFRETYPGEVETRETTPKLGGVRASDVALLVKEGFAEWTVAGQRARWKRPTAIDDGMGGTYRPGAIIALDP